MNDLSPFLRFSIADSRYDEHLISAFDVRYYPSLYVIDNTPNGVDNGTVYQWDTYDWITIDTFADWVLNTTYKNSSIIFPTPRLMFADEL